MFHPLLLLLLQARVLLRLGRPVDVAERGLVFVQNFLAILAAREAAGLIKPWFKEVCLKFWGFGAFAHRHKQRSGRPADIKMAIQAFSACMFVIAASVLPAFS
jgi:hypothetical protein